MSPINPIALNCLDVQIDEHFAVWAWFRRPSFTPDLLADIGRLQTWLSLHSPDIGAIVWGSREPGVWNRGGDLELFHNAIAARDRGMLEDYARACIDAVWQSWNSPVLSIALVQGEALGGGFEAALTNAVIIAEPGARFGFPEILFNSFPGMGAYSLLVRRGLPAWPMIASGRIYSAAEMREAGVVDLIGADGAEAARKWLHRHRRSLRGLRGLAQARARAMPLEYDELAEVAWIWAREMLEADEHDLRRIDRLRRAQHGEQTVDKSA